MNAPQPKTPAPAAPTKRVQKAASLVKAVSRLDVTPVAKQIAAAILDVLAGVRTTGDAAKALAISLPRYYILEARAIEGLIRACVPKRPGRERIEERAMASLERENGRLERECSRLKALARAAQRTLGLTLPGAPAEKKMSDRDCKGSQQKKRARRPVARALVATKILSQGASPTTEKPNVNTPLPPRGTA